VTEALAALVARLPPEVAALAADPRAWAALVGATALALALRARGARRARDLAARIDALAGAQQAAARATEARLSELTARMGETLAGSAERTAASLGALQARLSAIDRAQETITRLSGDVLGLQDILAGKQTRGAFGEIQLNDILATALPPDAWRRQATLSTGARADALILLPDPPGPIAIDSKFPLEAYEALRAAAPGSAARREAARDLRVATRRHLRAVAEKYILPGETAEGVLMFLPSEAVYAELHANFGEVVREGFAAQVWIVSPTTCMAVLNTMRGVMRDARLRDEAAAIRAALGHLSRDIGLVAERTCKLRAHLRQAEGDLAGLAAASERAQGRIARLEAADLDPPAPRDGVRILRG